MGVCCASVGTCFGSGISEETWYQFFFVFTCCTIVCVFILSRFLNLVRAENIMKIFSDTLSSTLATPSIGNTGGFGRQTLGVPDNHLARRR